MRVCGDNHQLCWNRVSCFLSPVRDILMIICGDFMAHGVLCLCRSRSMVGVVTPDDAAFYRFWNRNGASADQSAPPVAVYRDGNWTTDLHCGRPGWSEASPVCGRLVRQGREESGQEPHLPGLGPEPTGVSVPVAGLRCGAIAWREGENFASQ